MKRLALGFIAVSTLLLSQQAPAGWVDDYLVSKVSSGPDYYQGQQRGYMTGGTFAYRVPMAKEPILTLTGPSYEGGCGGLDLFMGSFSFMDPEYLVQKLQNMMQAAPAIMFDMALSYLSEKFSNTLKDFEQITDLINSTLSDDCRGAQKLVEIASSPSQLGELTKSMGTQFAKFSDSVFAAAKNPVDTIEKIVANNNKPKDEDDLIADCPASLRSVILSGSVIENAAKNLAIASYAPLIRGMFGDIVVKKNPSTRQYEFETIPACVENVIGSPQQFITAKMQSRVFKPSSSSWVCEDDSSQRIDQYVENHLNAILNNMRTQSAHSSAQITFMEETPVPVYQILKMAHSIGNELSVIPMLDAVIANGLAYNILRDAYSHTSAIIAEVGQTLASTTNVQLCNVSALSLTEKSFKDIQERLHLGMTVMRDGYSATVGEVNTIIEMIQRFEDVEHITEESIVRLVRGHAP